MNVKLARTDDDAWEEFRRLELFRRNVDATNSLLATLQKPRFRHILRSMAEVKRGA